MDFYNNRQAQSELYKFGFAPSAGYSGGFHHIQHTVAGMSTPYNGGSRPKPYQSFRLG